MDDEDVAVARRDPRPTYENLWLVTLDDEGRARHFTEWFMVRKGTEQSWGSALEEAKVS